MYSRPSTYGTAAESPDIVREYVGRSAAEKQSKAALYMEPLSLIPSDLVNPNFLCATSKLAFHADSLKRISRT